MGASTRHDTATDAARRLYYALQNAWPIIPAESPPDGVLEHGEKALGVFYPHDKFRLDYARWVGADVVVTHSGPNVVFGNPGFVAGYTVGSIIMRSRTHRKAQRLANAQWRQRHMSCAVVTDRRLWCLVPERGGWQWFNHTPTTSIDLQRDALVMRFPDDIAALRLSGPATPWIAVACAYYSYDPDAMLTVPWLATILHTGATE